MHLVWDEPGDRPNNLDKIEEHGLEVSDIEQILDDPASVHRISRSSGRPIAFGCTSGGKHIAVLDLVVNDDPLIVYPVTAYEVPEPGDDRNHGDRL